MPDNQTAQEILDEAKHIRAELGELDFALQEEIDEIGMTAAREDRPLSEDEKKRRNEYRASKLEVQNAFREFAFITLARLNSAPDVIAMTIRLDSVNKELEDDLQHLKSIERYAIIAAKIADGVTKLAIKVGKLMAS